MSKTQLIEKSLAYRDKKKQKHSYFDCVRKKQNKVDLKTGIKAAETVHDSIVCLFYISQTTSQTF